MKLLELNLIELVDGALWEKAAIASSYTLWYCFARLRAFDYSIIQCAGEDLN